MLRCFVTFSALQLAGEVVVAWLQVPLPGSVVGLAALLAWLQLEPSRVAGMTEAATLLSDHLGLLFVPAGVGVIAYGAALGRDGIAIAAVLLLTGVLAVIFVGLLALIGLTRRRRLSAAADIRQDVLP